MSAVPQLIWLSEHKELVLGSAGVLLAVSGLALWNGRNLPCPTDPGAARACRRLRRTSVVLYGLAFATTRVWVKSGLKGISLPALTPQSCDMPEFGSLSFVVNRHRRCTRAI